MSLKSRRELTAAIRPRYQQASRQQKQQMLDEFVAASGYHRKYAIQVLKRSEGNDRREPGKRPGRRRVYTAEVQEALVAVWKIAHRICGKRLVPFLPELVAALERHGQLVLPNEIKERLLSLSPATADRLLAKARRAEGGGGGGRSGRSSLLKQQVPVRTFGEWAEAQPGDMEADLVAHCGGDVSGSYLHTLVMTDVVSGWTECQALLFRDQQLVLQAVRQIQAQLPVPLRALDTDNGSEFLNNALYTYCDDQEICFTRSRPYKKNDQCFVEQKNGLIVRQFVGYERLAGVEPCRILANLYDQLRLYINFFQPSLKLQSKERIGSRVIKRYDQAQTPCQRLLADERVPATVKQQLQAQFLSLDPVQLLHDIQTLQDALWAYAEVVPTTRFSSPTNGTGRDRSKPQIISDTTTRRYRPAKPQRRPYQGPRWWRTRPDPFADVWTEVKAQLTSAPDLSAKALFVRLQQQHPGRFSHGQLRTFQRRVRDWRQQYIARQQPAAQPQTPVDPLLPSHDKMPIRPARQTALPLTEPEPG
jgi:hypothetical protein